MTKYNNDSDWWDPYSCQPYKLRDSNKPRMSASNLWEYGKIATTALILSPVVATRYALLEKKPKVPVEQMAGLSINADPEWQTAHVEMVEDIGVKNLLIRIPSWDTGNLDQYVKYMSQFPDCEFVVNILQNRDSVDNHSQWKTQIKTIFEEISPLSTTFKIGNAFNRSKWGCRHSGEAIKLLEIADKVRKAEFPDLFLLGSSIIDFEPLVTLRTLFNFSDYYYDGCASLMYINRRGSAFGKQYGFFDLEKKLKLTKAMLGLSNNTNDRLWVTETNWPLLDTKPYTPNSGHPRSTVDEQTQAEYLTQYFTIASMTGWVERTYWWQLINPGYGLVDHRSGKLRKMPSYFAFKALFDGLPDQHTHN